MKLRQILITVVLSSALFADAVLLPESDVVYPHHTLSNCAQEKSLWWTTAAQLALECGVSPLAKAAVSVCFPGASLAASFFVTSFVEAAYSQYDPRMSWVSYVANVAKTGCTGVLDQFGLELDYAPVASVLGHVLKVATVVGELEDVRAAATAVPVVEVVEEKKSTSLFGRFTTWGKSKLYHFLKNLININPFP